MSVQSEIFRKFIGKPARDVYGRLVGFVVGLILDSSGRIFSVGVDCVGRFEEFPQPQIMVRDENILIIPH